jgi:hypothetical protein
MKIFTNTLGMKEDIIQTSNTDCFLTNKNISSLAQDTRYYLESNVGTDPFKAIVRFKIPTADKQI